MALLGQIVHAFVILIAVAKLSSKGVGSQLGSHLAINASAHCSKASLCFEERSSGDHLFSISLVGENSTVLPLIPLALCNRSLLASHLLQDCSQLFKHLCLSLYNVL